MAISMLLFDNKYEYLKSNPMDIMFQITSDFTDFNIRTCNERFIDIISNIDKIENEIRLIIEFLKQFYSINEEFNFFNDEKLIEISDIFLNFSIMANEYAIGKTKELNENMIDLMNLIGETQKNIKEYEDAIQNRKLLLLDKYKIIEKIEKKHHEFFPEQILGIYNILKELEIQEREIEFYNDSIVNIYRHEYEDFLSDAMEEYIHKVNEEKKQLEIYNDILLQQEERKKTIVLDSTIEFLENSLNSIYTARFLVNAWFGIDCNNKEFDWNCLSKEYRLCFAYMLKHPAGIGIKIPRTIFMYAIRDNDKLLFLEKYTFDKYIDYKEDLALNIFNEFKEKEIIELRRYDCENIEDIMNVMFYQLKLSNCQVNKCQNCGKYFIPQSKSNEKYCDRISPQNSKKTCKEYGVNRTYREEVKSNSIKYMHNNIGQAFRMRIKRAKTEKEKKQHTKQFEVYKTNYLKLKEKYNNGKLTEEKFLVWLKKQREELMNSGNKATDKE